MSARALLLSTVVVLASGCNCGPGGGASGGGSGARGGGAASSGGGAASSGGGTASSGGGGGGGLKDGGSLIDPNAFWKNDPPPMWCGPDGGSTPPTPPGGTPECPDDKNRQGCPCPTVGMTAPCWPGLRANRGLGICMDGTTTCESQGELGVAWGECKGYVAPTAGATGAAACQCFSAGQWALANLSPCFVSSGSQVTAAVSTYIDGAGKAQCPSSITNPPTPQPGKTFTTDTLKVDCAGHFKLCYELKAGQAATPKATDCSLAKVCVEADYPTANMVTPFPDLPSWVSTDSTCANAFATTGGYGEMSVVGQSVRCDTIDDGKGGIKVFNRVQYCPLSCNQNPNGPGCAMCGQGGSGGF
ncbi:MAG: hypothetical protein K1X89_23215 [Myxococcaceae bacterium]|nr:hypothetical protein [Myxococcaceae bacterium]